MLPRRGFLAVLAGALGAAFLPKSKAKPIPPFLGFVDAGTFADKAHSPIVICDQGLGIEPGQYIAGRGIPTGSQVVSVHTAIDPDPCSAVIELRMEDAGDAMREMMANTLFTP